MVGHFHPILVKTKIVLFGVVPKAFIDYLLLVHRVVYCYFQVRFYR